MTYKEIMKSADNETVKQRVKAIYPHIVVSGDIDKPYYSIHWYDIEKEKMYCGFSSFKLELVRKWLEEEFEVVEADIDDLIDRQKAEIERLQERDETAEKIIREQADKIFNLQSENGRLTDRNLALSEKLENSLCNYISVRETSIKEFAERLKEESKWLSVTDCFVTVSQIDNLVKEMAGEG